MRQASVTLLFRKENQRYFSIEKVFANLMPFFSKEFTVHTWYAPSSRAKPADIFKNGLAARKRKSDVYHITGDVHYLAFFLPSKRTVLTIHDCIFLKEKNSIKRRLLKWLFLDGPVRSVKYITTISEATKKDIVEYTRCRPDKVTVIPNAVDPAFFPVQKAFNRERPVILQVGTFPNKNLERVAAALKGITCTLDIIGLLSKEQVDVLSENQIEYTNSYNISKDRLVARYQQCDLVLFATTFEGFGLPVLEAQQCGKPLITSNISPVAEVAGDGARFIDPLDIQSIRTAVEQIITDEQMRKDLVTKGFKNVERYSLQETADLYCGIYRKIIKEAS